MFDNNTPKIKSLKSIFYDEKGFNIYIYIYA